MKHFRWTEKFILWKCSYANLLMYMCTIPRFEAEKEEKKPESKEQALSNFLAAID